MELVNLNNTRQPISIKRGDPLMHIEYISREGEPSPYHGDYMFQYMSDDEVALYSGILKEHFKGIFDSAELEKMAKERIRG